MLEDARHAPLSIFLTVPSTVPATSPELETAGGDLTPTRSTALFDDGQKRQRSARRWISFLSRWATSAAMRSLAAALERGKPVSRHIYAASSWQPMQPVAYRHARSNRRDIADDLLDAGVWIFLRGGPPRRRAFANPKQSRQSRSWALRISAFVCAPMTAMRTISCSSAWIG